MEESELRRIIRQETQFRTGLGFDVHQFAKDRKLILGGVDIPNNLGLLGHSDADVLVHAIMDALLGAICSKDIGVHFPDTDPKWKNADSINLLKAVTELVKKEGYIVENTDALIIAQGPKMSPYFEQMAKNIAQAMGIATSQVNIKATTTEKLGFTGRKEGIAGIANILLRKNCNF